MADAQTDARPSRGPDRSSPSSPIPTTSRWPAAARWRASPTPAPASCCSARRAAKRGSISDPALVAGRRPRPRPRRASCARPRRVLGVADVIVLDHPDGDLRWADVPELHAEIVAPIRRYRPDAVITFAEDGLYWHLDHIGVHERTLHRRAVARRRRAAALLRHDAAGRDARGRRGGARQGRRAAGLELLGHRARRVRRRRQAADASSSTCATGCRASWPRCAATARRWARTIRSPGSTRTRRGAGSASNSSAARRSTPPATPMLEQLGEPVPSPCSIDTLDILRCPYCGGRLDSSTSLFHRASGDEIHDGILGCHCCIFPVVDGIPVLHLQPAATAAREHIEAGPAGSGAARDVRPRRRGAGGARSTRSRPPTRATYRDIVEALGPNFEGGYFLYRFSDPTYIVAHAVVRAVARHGARAAAAARSTSAADRAT